MKNDHWNPIDTKEFFKIHGEKITKKMKEDLKTIFQKEDQEKLKQKRIEKLNKLK